MTDTRKRILILNYEFPPMGGGGGVAAYKLAKGFIEIGYEVDILTSWYKGLEKYEVVSGIRVYRVPVLGRRGLQTATMLSLLTFPFMAFPKGVGLCRTNHYECINTHFVVPTGPLGYILSRLFTIKNILSLHGGDIYDPTKHSSPHRHLLLRMIIRFLLNHADEVVAQSSNTKVNTLTYYAPKQDIQIIPLAYESFIFTPVRRTDLGLRADKKYIIGAGRLVKRKGFDSFIRTLALLDDVVEGILVGEGPERQVLEKLASELGVRERLHFVGQVSEERKFQYLSTADVYVLSSVHEGFGIVLQEAMQVGLPIVATNTGGQIDLVEDGVNGALVFHDVEKMKDAVLDVLYHEERAKKYGEENKKRITQYAIAEVANKYITLL